MDELKVFVGCQVSRPAMAVWSEGEVEVVLAVRIECKNGNQKQNEMWMYENERSEYEWYCKIFYTLAIQTKCIVTVNAQLKFMKTKERNAQHNQNLNKHNVHPDSNAM